MCFSYMNPLFLSQLETRYKGNGNYTQSDKEEFFRGVVKFSSSSLLESLRHCVASGEEPKPFPLTEVKIKSLEDREYMNLKLI